MGSSGAGMRPQAASRGLRGPRAASPGRGGSGSCPRSASSRGASALVPVRSVPSSAVAMNPSATRAPDAFGPYLGEGEASARSTRRTCPRWSRTRPPSTGWPSASTTRPWKVTSPRGSSTGRRRAPSRLREVSRRIAARRDGQRRGRTERLDMRSRFIADPRSPRGAPSAGWNSATRPRRGAPELVEAAVACVLEGKQADAQLEDVAGLHEARLAARALGAFTRSPQRPPRRAESPGRARERPPWTASPPAGVRRCRSQQIPARRLRRVVDEGDGEDAAEIEGGLHPGARASATWATPTIWPASDSAGWTPRRSQPVRGRASGGGPRRRQGPRRPAPGRPSPSLIVGPSGSSPSPTAPTCRACRRCTG